MYVVIDNTPGSNSSKISVDGVITYIPLQLSSLVIYEVPMILALVVGVAGLIVIIYGLVKKGGQDLLNAMQPNDGMAREQRDKEYLEQIYKGVDSDKKKRSKKGRRKETEN
jgi:predicted Co/Zn/Cd cation transporter (cation efflux family)